jgi:stage II sporulation protein D
VRQGRQGRLVNVATGGRVALVPGVYRVRYLPDRNLYRVVNRSAGRAVGSYRGPLVFQPAGGGPLGYGPRNYRGSFVVRASGANVMLVNRLPLELYVRGVVAMEMPASWHQQALRAQAVAVRSFARAALGGGAYDLTTGSMVYGGASGETRATNRAVNATARTYAAYEGRPIPAFFSAANGGYSEASRFVFSPAPYLLAVRDVDGAGRPFERRAGSPWMRWSGTLDNDGSRLGVGTITRVEVTSRTRSGRALEVRVTGTRGARTISGQYDVRNSLRTTGLRLANGSGHPAGALPSARVYFGSQC